MVLLLNLLQPYLTKIVVVAACILAIIGVYLLIRHEGVVSAELKQRKLETQAYKDSVAKAQASSIALQEQLNNLSTENEKLKERLSDEVALPIYHTCTVPATGLRILNAARAGRSTN